MDYVEDNSSAGIFYLETNKSVQFIRDEFGADFLTILTMDGVAAPGSKPNPPSEETDEMIYATIGASWMLDAYLLPWAYGLLFGETMFIV